MTGRSFQSNQGLFGVDSTAGSWILLSCHIGGAGRIMVCMTQELYYHHLIFTWIEGSSSKAAYFQ